MIPNISNENGKKMSQIIGNMDKAKYEEGQNFFISFTLLILEKLIN